jgi:protein LTV1
MFPFHSCAENHPKVLKVPRSQRIRLEGGLPVDYLPKRPSGLSATTSTATAAEGKGKKGGKGKKQGSGDDESEDGSQGSGDEDGSGSDGEDGGISMLPVPERKKGETAEEKKARKAAVKANRKLARERKSKLKKEFKDEEIRQQHMGAGQSRVSIRPL